MRIWKCALLAASGVLLLQAGACVSDFMYYVMQAFANQLVASLFGTAASTT